MTKKVAILQSNYIPWKGYFDMIAAVDEFILFDDMQYTRRDWRNRNQIKTPQGVQWISVPVQVKGKYHQRIDETLIDGSSWQASHWKSLQQNYRAAPCFDEVAAIIAPLYQNHEYEYISHLNRTFIDAILSYLEVPTKVTWSTDYQSVEGRSERLISLCEQAGADEYISGPAAREYIDEELFEKRGIKLTWFSYQDYLPYPQLYGDFVHGVSILDLLFNCGKEAGAYMRFVNRT